MSQAVFYSCHLFDWNGRLSTLVKLDCNDDAEAVLAGRAFEQDFQQCSGFMITHGDRVIVRRDN